METAPEQNGPAEGLRDLAVFRPWIARIYEQMAAQVGVENDVEKALQILADGARQLFQSRLALVGVFEEEGEGLLRPFAVSHHESVEQPCQLTDAPGATGIVRALQQGEARAVLRLREVSDHPDSSGVPPGHVPLRGLLATTQLDQSSAVKAAFLVSDRLDGADFDEQDEALVHGFASFCTATLSKLTLLEHAEAQRDELHQRLLAANARLEAKSQELEDFAYVVSHDLKEPLRGARALSQFLLDDYGDSLEGEGREYLLGIQEACDRMKQLIEDVLALSRLDRQEGPVEAVDLAEVIQDVLADLRQAIEEANAEVQVVTALPVVPCDRVHVQTVFANLIGNAIKFRSERPPLVEIGYSEQDGVDGFFVRDNGIGIAPEHHERIFGLFQRLHARDEYEGTGAGLAIVKKIIEQYGGRAWVESEAGRGSTFHFAIPRIRTPQPAEQVQPVAAAGAGPTR